MKAKPGKYRPYPTVDIPDRRWPSAAITRPPAWVSVDLRDGNQALPDPMGLERKLRYFKGLVRLGFREIEVAFPSASRTELDFVRRLIDDDLIPEDVTIQVCTQARRELIERTIESIRGARRAIVHVYNSTSELQRRVVFGLDRDGIRDIAVNGVRCVRELASTLPGTEVQLEYSPESFTGTELDYALEVCEAVVDAWEPESGKPVILNLPATVEMSTPNVYADRVEWFSRRISRRDRVILSVHPHNDRGCAVAAAELAVMAGAERVEGTLFGNGERTGNVDLVTMALNLYSQGIDPGLDLSDLPAVVKLAEQSNRMPVHPRHPYGGELVFTAFSGSHQDAIRKGFARQRSEPGAPWEVPYLPVDPADLGRTYEAVIRINSQSGKGGVAYVLETRYGLRLPRGLQVELSKRVKEVTDQRAEEISPEGVLGIFEAEYLSTDAPLRLVGHHVLEDSGEAGRVFMAFTLEAGGFVRTASGSGRGPLEALVDALRDGLGIEVRVLDYSEHALGEGADAAAAAYVEVEAPGGGSAFGAGRDASIVTAALQALVSAVNRSGVHPRVR